jgi:hypothetical protein
VAVLFRATCKQSLAAIITALLMLTGACAQNSSSLPAAPSNTLGGPPGVPKSLEQLASEQATEVLTHFYEKYTEVLNQPQLPENSLDQFMLPGYYRDNIVLADIRANRAPGIKVTGTIKFSKVVADTMFSVIPKDARGAAMPGEAKLLMKACEDRSGLTTTKDGVVVKNSNVPTAIGRRFSMTNGGWPGGSWIIAGNVSIDAPCEVDI